MGRAFLPLTSPSSDSHFLVHCSLMTHVLPNYFGALVWSINIVISLALTNPTRVIWSMLEPQGMTPAATGPEKLDFYMLSNFLSAEEATQLYYKPHVQSDPT